MTPMKTMALALTLIIVTPILLGFGMATEEVERTVATTERGGSLSEVVLNHSTPYFVSYSGVNNNSQLYSSDSNLVVPDFVETSADTYTYTPIYETVSDSVTMSSSSYANYTSSMASYLATSNAADENDAVIPDFITAKFTIFETANFTVHTEDGYYTEQTPAGSEIYVAAYYNSANDKWYQISGLNGLNITQNCDAIIIQLGIVRVSYVREYTTLSIDADPWSADISDGCLALEVYGKSAYVDATGILYSGGTYTVSTARGTTETWTGVTGIALAPGVSSLDYERSGVISEYADVSYGWNLPTGSDYYYWFNGYENDYLRLMVHIESGETLILGDEYSETPDVSLTSVGGFVSLSVEGEDPVEVGTYTNLMVEIHTRDVSYNDAYVVVTGIYEWPSIGTMPTLSYNSVSVDFGGAFYQTFTTMYVDGSSTVELRADESGIYAGDYPSTNNYSYRPYSLFPSDDWQSVVIDSVGVYGNYLNIGIGYSVSDNNTITFTDLETSESFIASILGLTVGFKHTDGGYETYINGHLVRESSSAPFLQFGGLWSLTLHRTVTTEDNITATEWVPGEFAFDKDDFILALILTTVGVFVALGLYKGVRIGVLAVVCAAAGIIAFIIA